MAKKKKTLFFLGAIADHHAQESALKANSSPIWLAMLRQRR